VKRGQLCPPLSIDSSLALLLLKEWLHGQSSDTLEIKQLFAFFILAKYPFE
jgi:hypothetical protein